MTRPARGQDDDPAPLPSRPVAVLIEPSSMIYRHVSPVLNTIGYEVRVSADIPDNLETAAFLLVEADRGGRALSLAQRIHALRPALPTVGVLRWWNEDERDFASVADLIVHVPVRERELQQLSSFAATLAGDSN